MKISDSVTKGNEFIFWDSSKARNLQDMLEKVKVMSPYAFGMYLNSKKNEFANWVYNNYGECELVSNIKLCSRKGDVIGCLSKTIQETGNAVNVSEKIEENAMGKVFENAERKVKQINNKKVVEIKVKQIEDNKIVKIKVQQNNKNDNKFVEREIKKNISEGKVKLEKNANEIKNLFNIGNIDFIPERQLANNINNNYNGKINNINNNYNDKKISGNGIAAKKKVLLDEVVEAGAFSEKDLIAANLVLGPGRIIESNKTEPNKKTENAVKNIFNPGILFKREPIAAKARQENVVKEEERIKVQKIARDIFNGKRFDNNPARMQAVNAGENKGKVFKDECTANAINVNNDRQPKLFGAKKIECLNINDMINKMKEVHK